MRGMKSEWLLEMVISDGGLIRVTIMRGTYLNLHRTPKRVGRSFGAFGEAKQHLIETKGTWQWVRLAATPK